MNSKTPIWELVLERIKSIAASFPSPELGMDAIAITFLDGFRYLSEGVLPEEELPRILSELTDARIELYEFAKSKKSNPLLAVHTMCVDMLVEFKTETMINKDGSSSDTISPDEESRQLSSQ